MNSNGNQINQMNSNEINLSPPPPSPQSSYPTLVGFIGIYIFIGLGGELWWWGGGGGKGGYTLSVLLQKHINLPFSHKYLLLYFQEAFSAAKKTPEDEPQHSTRGLDYQSS